MMQEKSALVYSTDHTVPKTNKGPKRILQTDADAVSQKISVRLDRKGRGGKTVTVIAGLPMPSKDQLVLLRELKTRLGTGGVMKDEGLQIQGDHRSAIITYLEGLGYKPKRTGR